MTVPFANKVGVVILEELEVKYTYRIKRTNGQVRSYTSHVLIAYVLCLYLSSYFHFQAVTKDDCHVSMVTFLENTSTVFLTPLI